MLLPGDTPDTCHTNDIVTLFVTSMLYYRNVTCLLGSGIKSYFLLHKEYKT